MRIVILIFGFKGLRIDVFEDAHQLKVTFFFALLGSGFERIFEKMASIRVVSLAAVFWMSRNALCVTSKKRLRGRLL